MAWSFALRALQVTVALRPLQEMKGHSAREVCEERGGCRGHCLLQQACLESDQQGIRIRALLQSLDPENATARLLCLTFLPCLHEGQYQHETFRSRFCMLHPPISECLRASQHVDAAIVDTEGYVPENLSGVARSACLWELPLAW